MYAIKDLRTGTILKNRYKTFKSARNRADKKCNEYGSYRYVAIEL